MTASAIASRSHRRENGLLLDQGIKKKEKRGKMISFRLPKAADTYLRRSAKVRRGITHTLLDALSLHEALNERLMQHKKQLQQFALDEGLDWETDEPLVYVRLIERGLQDAERARK